MKKNHSEESASEDYVISCGGIQPFDVPAQKGEEVTECTEQF